MRCVSESVNEYIISAQRSFYQNDFRTRVQTIMWCNLMKEFRIYVPKRDQYMPTRKNLTRLITGLPLLPDGTTATKIMLTEVEPNGEFSSHVDEYHHVFYFIAGQGRGHVDNRYYDIVPNTIVEVPAGVLHGYQNTGSEPMQLISINIPASCLSQS